jgi:thermostable 8-oxoguanine DNA glycosylase
MMLEISAEFVRDWADKYDKHFKGKKDEKTEKDIREWLSRQPEPKRLNKDFFVKLGCWKSPRQRPNYEANDERLIEEATRLAYELTNERIKLHILKVLKGVQVPVASTILHFLQPDIFAIFDIRVRRSLNEAGKWDRDKNVASDEAWQEYIALMRDLSSSLGVTLRELDKALWAYDNDKLRKKACPT